MTMSIPVYKTNDILNLIPQRPPIFMVDGFSCEDEQNCHSTLTITGDNIFLEENGRLAEEGILEHIAQTAAAYVGLMRKQTGEDVNMGYIGDIKRCAVCGQMPTAGETLVTHLTIMSQVGNITLVSAETAVNGETILSCRMKLAN